MTKDPAFDEPPGGSKHALHGSAMAARWRRFEQTMMEAQQRFGSLSADELQAIIDQAVVVSRRAL